MILMSGWRKEIVEELYNIGLSDMTIKDMINMNPCLLQLEKRDIIEKEKLLKSINCSDKQIVNIISSNPLFLNRTNIDLEKLFNCLNIMRFTCLNILIDTNPDILNLEASKIEEYVKDRVDNGELLDDIIDDLEANPYLFN